MNDTIHSPSAYVCSNTIVSVHPRHDIIQGWNIGNDGLLIGVRDVHIWKDENNTLPFHGQQQKQFVV